MFVIFFYFFFRIFREVDFDLCPLRFLEVLFDFVLVLPGCINFGVDAEVDTEVDVMLLRP